jgi:hypothetical protein
MWPSLFGDPETQASFQRLRAAGLDERVAFMVAAVDANFRRSVASGDKPLEAYAASVADAAKINAIVEGYSPDEARDRQTIVYEKTLREGLDDPVHPHAERHLPTKKSLG